MGILEPTLKTSGRRNTSDNDRFLTIKRIPTTCTPEEQEFIRSVRARSLPPERITKRARSPSPTPVRPVRPSVPVLAACLQPQVEALSACVPKITRYYPEYSRRDAPHYTYTTRMPLSDTTTPRLLSNSPHTYGPKHLTGCSVFPTMRHSSYSLLEPIERYRYHPSSKAPTHSTVHTYLGYPSPTHHSSSAYRVPEVNPTRFQLERINEPNTNAFHAARRTLY